MGRKRIQLALAEALADVAPVVVRRTFEEAEPITGYVVALGDDWVVLHATYDLRLTGWTALRIDTIDRVRTAKHPGTYDRAMEFWGEHPHSPGIDPASTQSVLRTAGKLYPLIVVHLEEERPGVAYVGMVERVGGKRLRFRYLSTTAEWDPPTDGERLELREITKVEVGTDYTRVLWALAEEPALV
ncbi:MAG: hypothetical protein J7513_06410 [Solirubrobacteraceae bacterium]|nr:hypothetical protein [Solirubrobacteraceae bacterium]